MQGDDDLIMLSAPGGPTELEELTEWLKQDPETARRVVSARGPSDPSHMGSVVDALAIAVGSGGALTVLARGLVAWASTYRSQRGSDVRVEASRPGGVKLKVDLRNITDAEAILKQVLGRIDNGEA
jgi:hypothetical protein